MLSESERREQCVEGGWRVSHVELFVASGRVRQIVWRYERKRYELISGFGIEELCQDKNLGDTFGYVRTPMSILRRKSAFSVRIYKQKARDYTDPKHGAIPATSSITSR